MDVRSIYRDAVMEDGSYVLRQVVKHLYKGGNLRPDVYFSEDIEMKRKNYKAIFNGQQRSLIEGSGNPAYYSIENAVQYFDVTLLALLAEHTCGLSHWDTLLTKVKELRTIRNRVGHFGAFEIEPWINDSNIQEKLDELLDLFDEIIDGIDHRIMTSVYHVKQEVHRRINERMPHSNRVVPTVHYFSPQPTQSVSRSSKSSKSNDIPTWGKVAIGAAVVTGIAGLIGGLLLDDSDEEKKRKRRQK